MADATVKVGLEIEGASAGKFADVFKKSLETSLSRLGIGNVISSARAGATAGAAGQVAGGVAMGALLGVGIGLLKFIADVLADFPVVTAIMKLLKLILMILFLPLIPILKPVLILLGLLARGLLPIMNGISNILQKILDIFGLNGSAAQKAVFGEINNIGSKIGQFIQPVTDWLNRIMGEFFGWVQDMGTKIGAAIQGVTGWILSFENTLAIAVTIIGKWLGELPGKLWAIVFAAWSTISTWPDKIWNNILKPAFQAVADAMRSAVDSIRNIGQGIIASITSAAGRAGNFVRSVIGVRDAVIAPGGRLITTDPQDYLIATKNPKALGGGGGSTINININSPVVRNDSDIKMLIKEFSRVMQREQRRYTSYTHGG